jgi:hypothetical protein
MPKAQAIVPSASGYPIYSRLNNPIFARDLVERFQHDGVTAQFTTSNIVPSEIKSTGSEVILRREPEAELFDYQMNQTLSHSDLNTDIIRMVIDRAKYWNLKLDQVDQAQIANVNMWVNAFKKNAARKLDRQITREILIQVPHEVSKYNKGRCAGIVTGRYNMGTLGSPVVLTAKNFPMVLAQVRAVLAEQDVPAADLFMIVPQQFSLLLYNVNSPLYSVCVSGLQKSIVLLNGEMLPSMVGFDFIVTLELPILWDPIAEVYAYAMVAGRKDAIAFVTQLNKNRVVDNDPRSFSTYWQGLQVYGFKTIRPEALVVLYATIDENAE